MINFFSNQTNMIIRKVEKEANEIEMKLKLEPSLSL